MITENTRIPPTLPSSLSTDDNKDEPKIVYPCMFMSSLGSVKLNPEKTNIFGEAPVSPELLNCEFNLNFSVFKLSQNGQFHLAYVIANLNFAEISPQYSAIMVEDIASQEAKDFMLRPLTIFRPFKRCVLVFEQKGYTTLEFDSIMDEWKTNLGNIVDKIGE